MSEASDLYATDFARWAEAQARALRDAAETSANLAVDWKNVAEEIEALARTDRRDLVSRLTTVIEHLLKLVASPAPDPRAGWKRTIRTQRDEIQLILDDSPSLRREMPTMIEEARKKATVRATGSLTDHGEDSAAVLAKLHAASFADRDVVGDWFPDT